MSEISDSTTRIDGVVNRLLGKQRLWLHIVLFLVTYLTTTLAGEAWRGVADPGDLANLHLGLEYATLVMFFITAHEFGHFIAARIHKVDATLPFYIPFPGAQYGSISFGTMGAVIRTRSKIPSNKVMFDIGVAGPIAGFIACIIILAIGFATLPGIEYLQHIHPGYPSEVMPPGTMELSFGNTLFSAVCKNCLQTRMDLCRRCRKCIIIPCCALDGSARL